MIRFIIALLPFVVGLVLLFRHELLQPRWSRRIVVWDQGGLMRFWVAAVAVVMGLSILAARLPWPILSRYITAQLVLGAPIFIVMVTRRWLATHPKEAPAKPEMRP
jgi:hypothetical protein